MDEFRVLLHHLRRPAHIASAHPSSEYRRCTRSRFQQSLITFSSTIWLPSNTTKIPDIDNLCSMQDFVEPISERDII
ncbi:hypothetical protein L1987_80592 [Smallanthus sonchifolius]|uniref:Uncharacterized protein n=1 Tax=Smallanthus sonchifolius TaxID=185202 RepID=A0ACB8YMF7_9ASTR|nr:hypothetical protein L1987_80592 [Smallanthus sonchifolius]